MVIAAATQAANAVKAFNFAALPPVREAVLANAMQPFGQQAIAGIPVDQLNKIGEGSPPVAAPTGTSVGIPRIVLVTGATRIVCKTGIASSRVNTR